MPQIYLPGEEKPRDCDIPDLVRWDRAVADGDHQTREAAAAAEILGGAAVDPRWTLKTPPGEYLERRKDENPEDWSDAVRERVVLARKIVSGAAHDLPDNTDAGGESPADDHEAPAESGESEG